MRIQIDGRGTKNATALECARTRPKQRAPVEHMAPGKV